MFEVASLLFFVSLLWVIWSGYQWIKTLEEQVEVWDQEVKRLESEVMFIKELALANQREARFVHDWVRNMDSSMPGRFKPEQPDPSLIGSKVDIVA